MDKPKPRSRENRLSPEEIVMIKEACVSYDERLVIYGLLYTGMRESEFLHMYGSWINWKEGIIHIPYKFPCNVCSGCRADKMKNGRLVKPRNTFQGKTIHSERPVPIVPEVKGILMDFFSKHESVIDHLWYRQKIWRIVVAVGKRANIEHKVFPHCLRATFATILVDKGMNDPLRLKEIMGWKKLDMATQYIRLSGVGAKRAIDEIW